MNVSAILVLEDGSVFRGQGIGASGGTAGEVIFNTAMMGYEEILSDPSYAGQIITFTYPHIGNTGINLEDLESDKIHAKGIIMRTLVEVPSHYRSQKSLNQFLKEKKTIGIQGVDTRALTRLLQHKGALRGCIVAGGNIDVQAAQLKANTIPSLVGQDLASTLGVGVPKTFGKATAGIHIVILDFGVKKSIIKALLDLGARVTLMPANTQVAALQALAPQGVLLSNGPGDPNAMSGALKTMRALVSLEIPLMGICLGCQLLALALGAKTIKMHFGHHGCNHPIQDLATRKVYITSQNHGFCIEQTSLPRALSVTHRSLFDQSIQGFEHKHLPILGVQGHPEAAPGPLEGHYFFTTFLNLIQKHYAKTQ